MRQREQPDTVGRHPWIDDRHVERAVTLVAGGESVVFVGAAGSGAPLYVAAVEAKIRATRPDLWRETLWCADATALASEARMTLLETLRAGRTPVVVGLSTPPRVDAAAPLGRFTTTLSHAWLDGGAHRIDVARLSDDALIRVMRDSESAARLPLVSRARVVAWSNGVRIVAQQLHAAAIAAGTDVDAQRRAMARPHLGSALFDAYSSLLQPLSEHDQEMLARLVEGGGAEPAGDVVGTEMAMRLEAARVLSVPDADGIGHIPEPLIRVALITRALGGRSQQVQRAADTLALPTIELDDEPRRPEVAAVFERLFQMDFVGASTLARGILLLPSAAPRDRYLAAVAAGLATAYAGSWTESALLFERADTLRDVFPRDITGWDELLGLWMEAFARAFSGADLSGVSLRLNRRAVTAVRNDNHGDLLLASALSACLHAMAGDAAAAELELSVVASVVTDETAIPEWILPMVRIGVAACFALHGDVARAEELLQISRAVAARTPLVAWFLSIADAAVDHARGTSADGIDPERVGGLLRTGRGGLLLEMHALFHFVTAVRDAEPAQEHVRRLLELGSLVEAPVAAIVRRWGASPTIGRPGVENTFLLWSSGSWAGKSSSERVTNGIHLLSEREREVALLIAEGLSNRAIAERLYLSVRTVESHIYVARQKVGAASKKELGNMVAARVGSED